jgi:hypothetical protein
VRTTLTIADDVLLAAKQLAQAQRRTTGDVISDLARAGFRQRPNAGRAEDPELARLGITPLAAGGRVVTNELVNSLRDELDI